MFTDTDSLVLDSAQDTVSIAVMSDICIVASRHLSSPYSCTSTRDGILSFSVDLNSSCDFRDDGLAPPEHFCKNVSMAFLHASTLDGMSIATPDVLGFYLMRPTQFRTRNTQKLQ